jgi:hypothetical protein
MASSLKFSEYVYDQESELQRLGIWEFEDASERTSVDEKAKYWLMYGAVTVSSRLNMPSD